MTHPRLIFRWIVFLFAAFYCLRMLIVGPWDGFAGPFRYLTVWALFASFFCASRMMALEEGRSTRRWDTVVAMTAVLNAMVVMLYWRLYLADPASVTRNGQGAVWWLEYYLHALGPLLQWIDSLFVHRSFRRPLLSAGGLVLLVIAYVGWAEGVVQPLNDAPRGTVTSGLPYPFLNNLQLPERAVFYATNVGAALVMLAVFCALAWAVRRWVPAPKGPAALTGNRGTAD